MLHFFLIANIFFQLLVCLHLSVFVTFECFALFALFLIFIKFNFNSHRYCLQLSHFLNSDIIFLFSFLFVLFAFAIYPVCWFVYCCCCYYDDTIICHSNATSCACCRSSRRRNDPTSDINAVALTPSCGLHRYSSESGSWERRCSTMNFEK